MAGEFLIVDGLQVHIEHPDGAEQLDPIEIGDPPERSFAGDALSSVRGWKLPWSFRTRGYTRAEADALLVKLKGPPPIPCSGEALGGAYNCIAKLLGETIVSTAQGRRFHVKFRLEQE